MYLKEQLILILNHSREGMLKVVDRVDPNQLIYPSWKIKEVLAHMAGWDECIAAALEAHSRGETPASAGIHEPDIFNQQAVSARQDLSLEKVTADWESQRQKLIQVIEKMPDESFQAPALFPWGQVGAVEDIVRGFAAHERRHAEEIHRLIRLLAP